MSNIRFKVDVYLMLANRLFEALEELKEDLSTNEMNNVLAKIATIVNVLSAVENAKVKENE